MEGLLQLTVATWMINYPKVMPFAVNRQVGEIGGSGGVEWGQGVRLGQDMTSAARGDGTCDQFCASLA